MFDPTHLVTWKRATAVVVASASVAASMTVARQPVRASRLSVKITGSPTGTCTVTGVVNGSSTTEVLTWTGTAAARETEKSFTSITSVATSITGGTLLSARAVGLDGSPQVALYTVKGPGHPVAIHANGTSRWKGDTQGAEEADESTALLWYEESWEPRVGDRIVGTATGDAWEVLSVEGPLGGLRPTHWEATIRRLPDTATTP